MDKVTDLFGKIFNTVTSPLKLFGGLGGILKIGIFGFLSYFILSREGVQDWISDNLGEKFGDGLRNFINKIKVFFGGKVDDKMKADLFNDLTPDQAKTHLNGQIPEALYDVVTKEDNWLAFRDTVKAANGGKITDLSQITNSKSITKLMTDKPVLMADILSALKKSSTSTTATQVNDALKTIICGPDLDLLLNKDNLSNTAKAMAAMGVINPMTKKPATAAELELWIKTQLDKDGKPTQALRDALVVSATTAITGNAVAANTGTRVSTNTMQAAAITMIGAENEKHLVKLKEKLGEEKFTILTTALAAGEKQARLTAMKPDYITAVTDFAQIVDPKYVDPAMLPMIQQLRELKRMDKDTKAAVSNLAVKNIDAGELLAKFTPPNGADPQAGYIVACTLDPQLNNYLRTAGTGDVATIMRSGDQNSALSKTNLDAILTFTQTVSQNPYNASNAIPPIVTPNGPMNAVPSIITAFTELTVKGDREAFKNVEMMSHGAISAFFRDPVNGNAVKTLLDNLQVSGAQARVLDEMRRDYGNANAGIYEVLCDPAAVAMLMQSNYKPDLWDALREKLGTEDNKLIENKEPMQRLAAALDVPTGSSVTSNIAANSSNSKAAQLL